MKKKKITQVFESAQKGEKLIMNSKIIYILFFLIICCSISCVSAADLNETQQIEEIDHTLDLYSDNILNSYDGNLNENLGESVDNGTFQGHCLKLS